MDHLNYFSPYESKTAWHEDQLTRAFLVILRLVPIAHACFLDIVRDIQLKKGSRTVIPSFTSLPSQPATIETQVTTIGQLSGKLVSVVLTDEHVQNNTEIRASQRNARFDGVLCYPPDWVLVIENKPNVFNIWPEQLNPALPSGHEISIDPILVDIPWRSVVEAITLLLERKLLQGCEALLLDDFLRFVDQQFPSLNPFTTFYLCKENDYLLTKRCRAIMEQLAPDRVGYHRGFKDYIKLPAGAAKQAFFYPWLDEQGQCQIALEFYPGDTIRQAHEFFENVKKDEFFALANKGWSISPNMHFAFVSSNLAATKTGLSNVDYFDYWISRKDSIRQIQRDTKGFENYFQALLDDLILLPEDRPNLQRIFTDTKRHFLNPCPGFRVSYSWPIDEASRLDSQGAFIQMFKTKLNEALSSWNQRLS